MLHSQDSLHSGPHCPVSLAASDITALLPSHEEDFAAGREPRSRAALHDTPPAKENPNLICDNGRSLFASLMQIHHFWGIIGRRAIYFAHTERPWEPSSEFSTMVDRLRSWEHGLPLTHQWDPTQLQIHKADGHDLVRSSEVSSLGGNILTSLGIPWRDNDAASMSHSPPTTVS